MATRHGWRRATMAVAVACLVAAGCGDDGEESSTPLSFPAFSGTVADGDAEVCAIAQAMFGQDSFPTAEQLTSYKSIAPDPIKDQVEIAADPLIAAGDDMVATFIAFSDDDVEDAVADIDAWEESYCGIPHSEDGGAGPGATTDKDDDANLVEVTAGDFTFEIGNVSAGLTSFRLTNDGKQAHYLGVAKLADGVALSDALASEDGSGIESEWGSDLAAPGGDDEEFLTLDLAPGNYGLVCFLPDADGTPHAFKGMAVPFTVA